MKYRIACVFLCAVALLPSAAAQTPASSPFPDRFDWPRRTPAQAGFDAAALNDAIAFAFAHENPLAKDLALAHAETFAAREPFDALIGPTQERAALNGLIVHHGYVVADWGDTRRVDVTNSVTKTFLSTVIGWAWQNGLIRDVSDKVRDYMPTLVDLFDAPHNQSIT